MQTETSNLGRGQAETPNVGHGLLLIHRVISRGLKTVVEGCREYLQIGFKDAAERTGFLTYAQCLVTVLDGHHLGEDHIAFPFARCVLLNVPFPQLTAEHETMKAHLHRAQQALDTAKAGAGTDGLSELSTEMEAVWQVWQPHIKCEELHFSIPALAAAFKPEQHIEMMARLGEHGKDHSNPDFLVLPFILHNLVPEDRRQIARQFPPVISEQLVPIVWKEQWAPMKPFLLD